MRAAARLFFRLILRPLLHEPLRTALTVMAVALGVGVVVAIDLAGQAAAGSFRSSLESLTGSSDLVLRATGGVDERLLGKLVQLPYEFRFTPRIETFASINGRGEAIPFIGLDLVANGLFFAKSSGLWVGKELHLHAGDKVRLLVNDQLQEFSVAGVLPESENGSRVFLADIGLAQAVAAKAHKLDAIDVKVPAGKTIGFWSNVLRQAVPSSVSIEPQGTRTEENRKMLSAFRWNLRVLSYIALVVGAFLIYNTISISVVRRRNEIGVIRALGGSRRLILSAFLAEAGAFALAGTLLGILVGRVMAVGAVGLIGSTVQSLYVSSRPNAIQFTPASLLTGAALGVGMSLLAAIVPAVEASFVSPVEAMARGREQYRVAVQSRLTGIYALILILLSVAFALLPAVNGQPLFAYLAVLCAIGGSSLVMPSLVLLFARLTTSALQKTLGVEALIAMRSLRASIARTSILATALATAVAMTASVGIMVGSFRETVWLWMENQLKADFYLRPAGYAGADRYPTMAVDLADTIAGIPGVAAVDRFRAYPLTYEGMPATLAAGESGSGLRFLPGADRDTIP